MEGTLSFSAARIDVRDWLSNFDDSQITDNERKYVELLTTYDTSAELSYHKDYFDFLLENWLDLQTSLKQKHKNKKIGVFETQPHFVVGLTESPVNALILLSVNISILEGNYDIFLEALANIKEYEIKDAQETIDYYASHGVSVSHCAACKVFDLDTHNKGVITPWDYGIWPLINIIYDQIYDKKDNYYKEKEPYHPNKRNYSHNTYTLLSLSFGKERIEILKTSKLCDLYDVKAVWDYVLYKDRDRSDFSSQDIKNYEASKQIYLNATIEGE